jgi:hypothetical protein
MGKLFLVTSVIATVAAFYSIHQISTLPDGHPLVREPPIWSLGTPSTAPPGRPSTRGLGWQVANYLSGHGVLVVNVHTYRMDEVAAIALELTELVEDDYAEVLIYFYRPNETLAARRVQWSPSTGLVETSLEIAPHGKGVLSDNHLPSPSSKGS